MNKFLILPSASTTVALACCSTSILSSPFASFSTKVLFFGCALIFAFIHHPHNSTGYTLSLCLSNLFFIFDPNLYNHYQDWQYPFLAFNIYAIGLFIIFKEISEWNIINYLSNKEVWESAPEIRFIDSLSPSHSGGISKRDAMNPGMQTKTDFKVDMQGGVQGILQTTTRPLKYRNMTLGYLEVVTQVQLPQSALYDLFTSLDGSESTYKELFGHGLDHSRLMLDPRGNIVSWNPGVFRVLGYTRDDIIGKHVSLFYTVEDRIAGKPLADLVMARTDAHLETEGWMERKDGEVFWANVNITAVHNNSGQVLGFSVITRDYTDKKRSMDTVRAMEEKYHMLVSSVTDYTIIMLDPTGIITTWNAGAQKITGYHAEEIIGRHFRIFYDAEGLADRKPELELELATREGRFEEEGWRVRKDGTRFYVNATLTPIYNARKDIVGFSKVTRDITDKIKAKAAQEELRMVEERFQLLISSVSDYSIFMLDPNGIIVSWNLGAQRIKGYSAEEAIGKHFSIVYTPEDCARGKPQKALNTAASEGRYEDEGLRVRKDGSTFWANVIITPMRDNTGNLVGYSKVTRDVTERRQNETALRVAMQSAQAAALAKQSFLAMMSHEIRTPLHAVITLSFLLQSSELNAMQKDYLETIHNSSKQLLGIINDILDFSKIESGKMDLVVKPFNLRNCIEETIDLVLIKPITPRTFSEIDVVYILAAGVPEVIISDTVRVRQILMNYLSNAIKFTEKGEVVVRVSCDPKECKENDTVKLTFAVHDTGIGIKSPNLDDLFQPFFQISHDTPQIYGGTGLGLVISKKLSQLMGGNVWVESEQGVGSTFYFSITAQVGKNRLPPSSSSSSSSSSSPPCNVLVVDESSSGCESLELILSQLGSNSTSAHTYEDASMRFEQQKFDGVFITRPFHAQHPDFAASVTRASVPLYLTGTPDSSEYHTTTVPESTRNAAQFRSFLPKPYRTDLVHTLLRALRAKSLSVIVGNNNNPSGSPSISPLGSPLESPLSPVILPSTTPLRILVAEDNSVNRKVASRMLERLGYPDFDMVENGKEVLTALENKPYDVILMDIQMPLMDGWTATQEIFKKYPPEKRPEIIAMTAYAYEHDQQRCAQLGMKGHIAKPVDMSILADLLRGCTRKMM